MNRLVMGEKEKCSADEYINGHNDLDFQRFRELKTLAVRSMLLVKLE